MREGEKREIQNEKEMFFFLLFRTKKGTGFIKKGTKFFFLLSTTHSSLKLHTTRTSDMSSYNRELIRQTSPVHYTIDKGFVPNMRVPGEFILNSNLSSLMFEELEQFKQSEGVGGFLPAIHQIANVAALPGIVGVCAPFALVFSLFPLKVPPFHTSPQKSIGLPDCHSGYGFAIGEISTLLLLFCMFR